MDFKYRMSMRINEIYFKNYSELKIPIVKALSNLEDLEKMREMFFDNEEFVAEYKYKKEEPVELINLLEDLIMYYKLGKRLDLEYKSDIGKATSYAFKRGNQKVKKILDFESLKNEVLKEIIDTLKELSPKSYLVGGAIRDIVSNKAFKDYDFCTDTPYREMEKAFESKGFSTISAGEKFLVLNVSKKGFKVEISNFRKDTYSFGSRKPLVERATIEEDAARRDFTIGALYYNLSEEKIEDPNGIGMLDLLEKKIRFVGNPKKRLEEDYIRGYRFMKFIKRGFIPDKKSQRVVRDMYPIIHKNSNPSRVLSEFLSMNMV